MPPPPRPSLRAQPAFGVRSQQLPPFLLRFMPICCMNQERKAVTAATALPGVIRRLFLIDNVHSRAMLAYDAWGGGQAPGDGEKAGTGKEWYKVIRMRH